MLKKNIKIFLIFEDIRIFFICYNKFINILFLIKKNDVHNFENLNFYFFYHLSVVCNINKYNFKDIETIYFCICIYINICIRTRQYFIDKICHVAILLNKRINITFSSIK